MGNKRRRASSRYGALLDLFQHCKAAHGTESCPACRCALSRFRLLQTSERYTSLVQLVGGIVCGKNRHAGKNWPANRDRWDDARCCLFLYPDRWRGRPAGSASISCVGQVFRQRVLENPLLPSSHTGGGLLRDPDRVEHPLDCESRLAATLVFPGLFPPTLPDLLVWKV